jgi:hypothetical protein
MAEKLLKYYELVGAKGGLQAQMRLAMKTNMAMSRAKEAPDSAENLEKFYEAVREIVGSDLPRL